jgi:hypothetical protein
MKTIIKVACLIVLFSVGMRAEIEKNARVCDTGICFYWWPKLPEVKGWHQDSEQSFNYGANALAPNGSTFVNAKTVMYASASYKPRMPETKSLEMFITDDRNNFLAEDPSMQITEVTEMTTADGKKLRSFTFFPKGKGNWEQVSYAEEGDFYLTFTVSSRSKEGFLKAQDVYRELIAHYKENL